MTDVNIPALRKAVEFAEAEAAKPREFSRWYQGAWVITETELESFGKAAECGTCFCIAGFTASENLEPGEWITSDGEIMDADGHKVDEVCDRAEQVLRINPTIWDENGNSEDLFDGGNTIEDVRRIAETIAGERL